MRLGLRTWTVAVLVATAVASAQVVASPAGSAMQRSFEVATVKVDNSGSGGSHTQHKGDLFIATNVTLKNLLQYQAFGIAGPRVAGGPKWLDSARFDIEAKMDSSTLAHLHGLSPDEGKGLVQGMFQQLLAERFALKTHWEDREAPVYALVTAKGGPHLAAPKDPEHSGSSAGNGQVQAVNMTLAQFADLLTQEIAGELGRVVVDRTGVSGAYDMVLKWTPEAGPAGEAGTGPSIFTALQEQLGLRLEPSKGTVKMLVIDSASMPTEN